MNTVIDLITRGIMRNRKAAKDKRFSYEYRCVADKMSLHYEKMLINIADNIIQRRTESEQTTTSR